LTKRHKLSSAWACLTVSIGYQTIAPCIDVCLSGDRDVFQEISYDKEHSLTKIIPFFRF